MTIERTEAAALLRRCEALAVSLQADGEHLRFDGPEESLTPELLARLRAHKPDLLEILRKSNNTPAARCPVCGSSRRVSGLWSVWCRECADQGRETRLGDVGEWDATGDEYGDDPQDDDHAGGSWTDRGGRLVELAQRLRERYPIPTAGGDVQPLHIVWPPVVDPRVIADPIPTCEACRRPEVTRGQPGRPAGLCLACWQEIECESDPRTNEGTAA